MSKSSFDEDFLTVLNDVIMSVLPDELYRRVWYVAYDPVFSFVTGYNRYRDERKYNYLLKHA